ncbi:hypothetical protein NPIL_624531 [Nephila pilipes]|uniref:Uncharacterized protein n=1 Tax=Nephila pilipes TaxID=299642 RepID=A0A8X6NAB8_NEPPI|nr:hypothetical protein NPIL_624531 [Nephila pilipes]
MQFLRALLQQCPSPGAAPTEEAALHVLRLRHGLRRPHAPRNAQRDPRSLVRLRAARQEGPGGVRLFRGGARRTSDLQQPKWRRTEEAVALMVSTLLPRVQAKAAAVQLEVVTRLAISSQQRP